MKKFGPSEGDPAPPRTKPPFLKLRQLTWEEFKSLHWRHVWWHLLDQWEARRALRRLTYGLLTGLVVLAALFFWAYPWWNKRNAIRIARSWLASGHLRYAAEAAQRAAEVEPDNPEPWQIAAELARRGGQLDKALEFARRAAELAPDNADVVIGWAAEAVRADQPAEAERALGRLSVDVQAQSPYVQRLRGEIARRQLRFPAARGYFESAIRLEGPLAVNEVPLGLVLLHSTDRKEHQHGLDLLRQWAADRDWGDTAQRMLLDDALLANDPAAIRKWAEALWRNPRRTNGDMPQCLLGFARSDEARFQEVVTELEKDHAVSPAAAVRLISWLNQIGRSAEAVRWMQTLPGDAMRRPPLVAAKAEALRLTADWPALAAWTFAGDWGPEAEFLRWTYGMHAARMLGDTARADEFWRTLYSHAQLNSAHALFAGSTVYNWGLVKEAEALWWRAGEQDGPNAIEALGSLARHYQVQRDAAGQYRVFHQLHVLRPGDRAVGNNFAFYAALTGKELRPAEQTARANLAAEPGNRTYAATCAFVLVMQDRAAEAMKLLQPFAGEAGKSPALALPYGLALAATGRKAEARALLNALPAASLTTQEVALIKTSLAD